MPRWPRISTSSWWAPMPMWVVRASASAGVVPSGVQISAPGRWSFMARSYPPPRGQALADPLFLLVLHPRQRAQPAVRDRLLEVLGRGDAELPPQDAHRLGPQAGQLQQ